MLTFRLFGFPVRIHWMFWVLCGFLGMPYLEQSGPVALGRFLLLTVVVLGSVLWHELGHAWARKRFGAAWSEITLYGFGGLCSGPGLFTRWESVIIAAAGPGASLALGGVVLGIRMLSGLPNPWMDFAIGWLLWVNIGWAILNLLPILPLDGGHIAAGIAGPRHARGVAWLGVVFSALLIGLGLMMGELFAVVIFGMLAWGNWQRIRGGSVRGLGGI